MISLACTTSSDTLSRSEPRGPQFEPVGLIVLAHDAGSILEQTLTSLELQQGCTRKLVHVVIALNGGADETRRIAHKRLPQLRANGFVVDIIESALGRSNALNAAELLLPGGPRIYIDQDAQLSATAVADLYSALRRDAGWHFAAPRLELGRPPNLFTRWFYQTWSRLPYVRASPVTIGVYGVSAEGRQRWQTFPNLSNDDKFARLHTAPSERTVVSSATYSVRLPHGFRALVAARCRYIQYNCELLNRYPSLQRNDLDRYAGISFRFLRDPKVWLPVLIFLAVNAVAAVCTSGQSEDRQASRAVQQPKRTNRPTTFAPET